MAEHTNRNIWYSGHLPSPRRARLTYVQAVKLLLENGWPRNEEVLTTAAAVMAAESGRDPHAYLAYVDLGVDRDSKQGLALRAKIDALPDSITLTSFRHKVKELGAEVVRSDNGLFQIGRPPYEDMTIEELMTPDKNVRKALSLYKDRGFRPWAAYTTPRVEGQEPPCTAFQGAARLAVQKVLAG